MKLIVGLGNPGKSYALTRHNMGFMFVDDFASREGLTFSLDKAKKCELLQTTINNEKVIIIKPLTYMNLSGEAVLIVKQFYKIEDENILVIYDDLDLDPGVIRIRKNGSSGGHKGIQSIIDLLGTKEIKRIRIGIGSAPHNNTVDYVISKMPKEALDKANEAIYQADSIIKDYITLSFEQLMSRYN